MRIVIGLGQVMLKQPEALEEKFPGPSNYRTKFSARLVLSL